MNRIKQLREDLGYTQQELAHKLESSKSVIGLYESETRKPSLEVLIKLSEIFDCSIDYILGKSDVRKPNSSFNDDELHIALSKEDKGYISNDLKNKITEYAKFVIEQEKNKKDK